MSITDELRKYAQDWRETPNLMDDLDAGDIDGLLGDLEHIADRIDAEHERQLEVLYRDMSDAEYVKLPKDTGGKYIHEHDKVDWLDHAGTWHENATVVAVCDDGCYVMDGTVFHVHKSNIRHHHEPTVVDVLREFAEKVIDSQIPSVHPTYEEAITEYAAKLRLADDAE